MRRYLHSRDRERYREVLAEARENLRLAPRDDHEAPGRTGGTRAHGTGGAGVQRPQGRGVLPAEKAGTSHRAAVGTEVDVDCSPEK